MKKPRILIVEDESSIAELIAVNLRHNGFEPIWAEDGAAAQREIDAFLPDLVLLDWMLPGQSGLQLARQWRKDSRTKAMPILMLTARGDEPDKVAGLDAGADDYITKPFSQRLLIERIRALLRRNETSRAEGSGATPGGVMVRGDLQLDETKHQCLWRGHDIQLTVTEFLLVKALAARPGMVKSRDQLIDAAYGENIYVDDRTIDSHIKRVRK